MFSELKIAQMSAFLISLEREQKLPYLKLIKLLYLSERVAVSRWGESMSGDHFVSMPHGPVLSQTYDLIQSGGDNGWSFYIKGEAEYSVSLTGDNLSREDFDELSDAELNILKKTHEKFGSLNKWELVDYTHKNCSEWVDPKGSSSPISLESLIEALGLEHDKKEELMALHHEMAGLSKARSILH